MNGPPSPPPPLEPQGFFSGIRPVAVVIGALVDHLSTLALGLVLLSVLAAAYGSESKPLSEEALEALSREPSMLAAWMLLGSFCTGLGGFIAGRLAARMPAQHGAFVGLAGIAIGLLHYGGEAPATPTPLWYDLLGFALLVPAGALGGWLAGRRPPQADDADPRASGPQAGPS